MCCIMKNYNHLKFEKEQVKKFVVYLCFFFLFYTLGTYIHVPH